MQETRAAAYVERGRRCGAQMPLTSLTRIPKQPGADGGWYVTAYRSDDPQSMSGVTDGVSICSFSAC